MTGAQPHGDGPAPMPTSVPTPVCLAIDGELTIYRAEELKQVLLGALSAGALPAGAALECDLHNVTEVDTAGVQLLLLAAREARARSSELRLVGASAAVTEVFELLNLSAHFAPAAVSA